MLWTAESASVWSSFALCSINLAHPLNDRHLWMNSEIINVFLNKVVTAEHQGMWWVVIVFLLAGISVHSWSEYTTFPNHANNHSHWTNIQKTNTTGAKHNFIFEIYIIEKWLRLGAVLVRGGWWGCLVCHCLAAFRYCTLLPALGYRLEGEWVLSPGILSPLRSHLLLVFLSQRDGDWSESN